MESEEHQFYMCDNFCSCLSLDDSHWMMVVA